MIKVTKGLCFNSVQAKGAQEGEGAPFSRSFEVLFYHTEAKGRLQMSTSLHWSAPMMRGGGWHRDLRSLHHCCVSHPEPKDKEVDLLSYWSACGSDRQGTFFSGVPTLGVPDPSAMLLSSPQLIHEHRSYMAMSSGDISTVMPVLRLKFPPSLVWC